jgi:hypothetical protein
VGHNVIESRNWNYTMKQLFKLGPASSMTFALLISECVVRCSGDLFQKCFKLKDRELSCFYFFTRYLLKISEDTVNM